MLSDVLVWWWLIWRWRIGILVFLWWVGVCLLGLCSLLFGLERFGFVGVNWVWCSGLYCFGRVVVWFVRLFWFGCCLVWFWWWVFCCFGWWVVLDCEELVCVVGKEGGWDGGVGLWVIWYLWLIRLLFMVVNCG